MKGKKEMKRKRKEEKKRKKNLFRGVSHTLPIEISQIFYYNLCNSILSSSQS
jgi:hypothetical protein